MKYKLKKVTKSQPVTQFSSISINQNNYDNFIFLLEDNLDIGYFGSKTKLLKNWLILVILALLTVTIF